ncbi:MAG: peptidoglycan DD-metalloendopeptidase family protein [Bacteroidales bacterium]|nr:peptidoglycan DD-metalloendopeptidase family protein [Bacteroidales bacterium]
MNFRFIILLSIFIFGAVRGYSQDLPARDSLSLLSDSALFHSNYNDADFIPGDFSFVPAEILYDCIWDNYNIRYKSEILPSKKDTVMIPLIGQDDNCFVTPFQGKVISGFRTPRRKNHTGTDVKLSKGDSVLCAFDGKVRLARTYSGYGLLVLVRHNNGLETIYSHLSKILVKENQYISAGEIIGLGGRTGRATTDHLHFESRLFGIPFNSEKYIDFENAELKGDTLYYINGHIELRLEDFPSAPASNELIAGSVKGDGIAYKIQKGDTLSAIARKYNTSVNRICQDNNITVTKTLKIGEVLVIR